MYMGNINISVNLPCTCTISSKIFQKMKYQKILILLGLAFSLLCKQSLAQVSYSVKAETGLVKYLTNTVHVDPGPNWKGYNLYRENGFDINFINSLAIKKKFYAGIGTGYANFEGKSGISVFSDIELIPNKRRFSTLFNLKLGYNHLWNQYENGTGTMLVELGFGANYRLSEKLDLYLKSGMLFLQHSWLVPLRLGIRF